MPFKSEAQRRWMYSNYPKMAKRWSKHTPKNKELPEHVNECYKLEGINVNQGTTQALASFTLTNTKGAEMTFVFDTSNPEVPPDYVRAVIKDTMLNKMFEIHDPEASKNLIKKYGLTPNNMEEMMLRGAHEIEAKQKASKTDDGVMESLQFEALFTKIINS